MTEETCWAETSRVIREEILGRLDKMLEEHKTDSNFCGLVSSARSLVDVSFDNQNNYRGMANYLIREIYEASHWDVC
jgi:hypothetical protein